MTARPALWPGLSGDALETFAADEHICPGPAGGVEAPSAFSYVDRFPMVLAYGACVWALNSQKRRFPARAVDQDEPASCMYVLARGHVRFVQDNRVLKVRKTPSRPRGWANFSRL
jgi:hypothetical protein